MKINRFEDKCGYMKNKLLYIPKDARSSSKIRKVTIFIYKKRYTMTNKCKTNKYVLLCY